MAASPQGSGASSGLTSAGLRVQNKTGHCMLQRGTHATSRGADERRHRSAVTNTAPAPAAPPPPFPCPLLPLARLPLPLSIWPPSGPGQWQLTATVNTPPCPPPANQRPVSHVANCVMPSMRAPRLCWRLNIAPPASTLPARRGERPQLLRSRDAAAPGAESSDTTVHNIVPPSLPHRAAVALVTVSCV